MTQGNDISTGISRRKLLNWMLGTSIGLLSALFGGTFLRYIWPTSANVGTADSGRTLLSMLDIPTGTARMIRFQGRPSLVIHFAETEVTALSAVCPHLGCLVNWDNTERVVVCPCHAAKFDYQGNVLSGPSPKALASIGVRIEGDQIVIGEV
jgi:cytochrome b6-f complex iron-sulfur subunit